MESNQYLDFEPSVELSKLFEEVNLLQRRFQAISIDYKNFISPHFYNSVASEKMNEYSSNLQDRLSCSVFHIELLCNHYDLLQNKSLYFVNNRIPELYFLFDSFLYHVTSLYDYTGTLINFICENTQNYVKWNSIVKSYQHKKKPIYELSNKIDKEFVNKLFEIRSKLIHNRVIFGPNSFETKMTFEGVFTESQVITSKVILSFFNELSEKGENVDISLRYTSVFIIRKTLNYITDILFELKSFIELNKRQEKVVYAVLQDGIHVSASKHFWHEELR